MADHSKFFKKYTLNNKVEVQSLLVAAPMTLWGSNPDGTISEEERKFLKSRGKGIGLYILGATGVSLEGLPLIINHGLLMIKIFHLMLKEPKL